MSAVCEVATAKPRFARPNGRPRGSDGDLRFSLAELAAVCGLSPEQFLNQACCHHPPRCCRADCPKPPQANSWPYRLAAFLAVSVGVCLVPPVGANKTLTSDLRAIGSQFDAE
jgi:hypothetical protein